MSQTRPVMRQPVEQPDHAVRSEFLEPILFLAERMAAIDPIQPRPDKPMVDRLAELVGVRGFRDQQAYRRLSESHACELLSTDRARKAALVVLSLVLKTDSGGSEAAKARFSELRERLGMDPITVPANTDEHLGLALDYLRD